MCCLTEAALCSLIHGATSSGISNPGVEIAVILTPLGHSLEPGISLNTETPSQLIDAATVVVVRDRPEANGGTHMEVLMLRKSSKVHFGGMWVFPGGRVDDEERSRSDEAEIEGFKRAAVREAQEEAAIDLSDAALVHFSHWLPPPIRPKRFSTHFFLAKVEAVDFDIQVDGGEIMDHQWVNPDAALKRRHAGDIEIVTPTFVTLDWLRRYPNANAVLDSIEGPQSFHTHIVSTDEGNIAFYHGDVAYESMDLSVPGPRRRLNMLQTGWWWEEHDGDGNGPWPKPIDFSL